MGFTLVNELPTPAEILEQFPLADHLAALKKERDEEIKKTSSRNCGISDANDASK